MLNLVNSVNLFMEVVLVVFSIPGNLLIIVVSYLHAQRSTTDLLIGVQAVIDLLAAIPAFYSIVMITGPEHVNDTFCKIKSFSLRYVRYTSLFLMAAIALDRFRVICRALDQRWSWKTMHIVVLVLFCNILGFVISLPNALMTVPHQLVNGVRCIRSVNQIPLFDNIYPLTTTLLFFLALIFTSALYVQVFRVIRKQNRTRAAMTAPPTSEAVSAVHTTAGERSSDTDTTGQTAQVVSTLSGGNPMQELWKDVPSVKVQKRRPLLLFRCAWRVAPADPPEVGKVEMNGLGKINQSPTDHQSANRQQQNGKLLESQPSKTTQMNLLMPSHAYADADQPKRPTSPGHSQENRLQRKKKKKTTKQSAARKERQTTSMLLVITIIFFVSWFPGVITTHIPSPTLRAFRQNVLNNLLVIVVYALRNVNHIVNVFIYTLMSRRFKQQCTQVIRKLLRRRQH